MAERPAKKHRASPVARITAKERVKQFPTELYEDGGILFCFCDHSIDLVRVDTIKDHLKSKKHKQRRDIKEAESSGETRPVQVTLTAISKSKDVREEFILDFIKCALFQIFH